MTLVYANILHMSKFTNGKKSLQDIVTYNVRVMLAIRQRTQKGLAEAMKISAPTLSQKFTGRTRWNMDDIEKASSYFKVKPEALVSSQLVGPQGLEPWTDGL
ncbi:helix-turn-helix domain-containing protein [Gardnerella swidsinskii]|jgi:hypothetical protein|uniref:helix-turn-helix domain-containing protein n=3 Tax=Bifidobacteriaceae TaxID=31953 RepID=UPI0001D85559|nr:hypothetical protein GV51_1235 [Gardnerella vaginalis 5-1]UQA89191.1 helix-turn-helix domain-containing protein [Gardnerella swidsinskii]